jgi:hypothetical protein
LSPEPKVAESKPVDVRIGSFGKSNNNPLRGDSGSEMPAAVRFSAGDLGTDSGDASNASRGNPLRRQ